MVVAPGWQPLIDISGSREIFDARHQGADENQIVHFLIADAANPGSIFSSLSAARENARTLRDMLPAEAWELLNHFYLELAEELSRGLSKRAGFAVLKRIVQTSQTLTGGLGGTMNRNDAYTFLVLGRNLERADISSRIVDVRSAQLLPAETPELRPFDSIQWMSVLKSLSGYQMYRIGRRTRVSRIEVLEFLLRDVEFPRACLFCLKQVAVGLRTLPRSAGVLDTTAGACHFLDDAALAALDQAGLHALIDQLQLHISGVHDGIARTYFPAQAAGAADSVPTQVSEQRQTMPLIAVPG